MMVYCPNCLSDEINRTTTETVRYNCKKQEVSRIDYDDANPSFFCMSCATTFNNTMAKGIKTQITAVWKYLCEKHGWSSEDIAYKHALLKSINDIESWNTLFNAIWNEKLGNGFIEWEWSLTYTTNIYDTTSSNAVTYLDNEDIGSFFSFEKVRWNPNWQYTPTK